MSDMRTQKAKPGKVSAIMRKCVPQTKARNMEYPETTEGSKLAAGLRKKGNALTEEQRGELFEKGMQIVYGGSAPKEKVRS